MYIDNYINPKPQRSLFFAGEQSLGIVVKTPEELEKDNVVGVYIPRFMFGLPNEQGAFEEDISVDTKLILNSKNKSIGSKSFKSKNYLVLPVAQNGCIVTANLVKGENVFVECCDRDIKNLFVKPSTIGDNSKRKDDVFTILVPNFKEWNESPTLNLDNTYGLQIDTKKKILSLWTTCEGGDETSDKEKGKYMISINSAEGKVMISDNGKRQWMLNTEEDSITAQNEGGCKIQMIDDTINISAPSTINIETTNDDGEIHVKSNKLIREHTDIETSADTDKEEIKTLEFKGTDISTEYDTTKITSNKTYENKAKSSWKTDSPVSGFTKILTANEFDISSNAGQKPMPTAPIFDSKGKLKAGNPSASALPVTLFMPTSIVLNAIAAKVDGACSALGIPPTCAAAVASWQSTGKSKYVFG